MGALGGTNISRDTSAFPNLIIHNNEYYVSYWSHGIFVKKNTDNTLVPLSNCTTPYATANNIDDTSATLSWFNSLPVLGYEYHLSTTNTPPIGNGVFTNSLTYAVNGLQPNTTYYFFVRALCGIDTSAWKDISFTTTNTTSVTEMFTENADIKVYPNPVTNILNIEQINTEKQQHLELYDMFGRVVRTIHFSTPTVHVDLESLSSGIYFLRSKAGEKSYSFKVVKQ